MTIIPHGSKKVRRVLILALLPLILGFTLSAPPVQASAVEIEGVIMNHGLGEEVGINQSLNFEVNVSTFGLRKSSTEATCRISISNSSGVVEVLPAQTQNISANGYHIFQFNTIANYSTGHYNATASVAYDNVSISRNRSFKVVSLAPLGLRMAHPDFAPGETATFLQGMGNPGSVDANATVKVWVIYDDPDSQDRIEATEPPKSETIRGGRNKSMDLLWSVPSSLGACDYTNSSRYSTYSNWRYTTSDWFLGNTLAPINLSYAEVNNKVTDGYRASGLDQVEVAPGDQVSGGIQLLNRGFNDTVIHEVRAWVEDQEGNKITTLSPTGDPNSVGKSYIHNNLPSANITNCSQLSNYTIALRGSRSFSFAGALPEDVSLNPSYKVSFGVDYGFPSEDFPSEGDSWNILQNYSFEVVKAEVSKLDMYREVALGVDQKITPQIKNLGKNKIDSLSLYTKVYSPHGEVKNFSDNVKGLEGEETANFTYSWDIPGATLGRYTVNSTLTYATGAWHTLSKGFRRVFLPVVNVSAPPVAPYESSNIGVVVNNSGPTRATMVNLSSRVLASKNFYLGAFNNVSLQNQSAHSFNFSFYFDPLNEENGSFPVEVHREYGHLSYSANETNITLLPLGVKSFSPPAKAVANRSFRSEVELENIASSPVNVALNLTADNTGANYTTLTVPPGVHKYELGANLSSTGQHNLLLMLSYPSLPAPLERSGSVTLFPPRAELSVEKVSFSPSSPREGDDLEVVATLLNNGTSAANSVPVSLVVNGTPYATKNISLGVGSQDNVSLRWSSVGPGTHNLSVFIDPNDEIVESNEIDNQANFTVAVSEKVMLGGGGGRIGGKEKPPQARIPWFARDYLNHTLGEEEFLDLLEDSGKLYTARKYSYPEDNLIASAVPLATGGIALPESIAGEVFGGKGIFAGDEDIYHLAADHLRSTLGGSVIVVARGDNPVDALAGSHFASMVDGRILFTRSDELPRTTLKTIASLKPRQVYIVGGKEAISREVQSRIHSYSYSVERIGGEDRYETSMLIARKSQDIKKFRVAVVTSGMEPNPYAPVVARLVNAPLIYYDDGAGPEVKEYLESYRHLIWL